VIEPKSYLELLGRTVSAVLRNPGRHVQSVAESSFDAWIKYYRRDENSPNAVVSYYLKGSLVALALDLTLRECGASLDALMRELWRRHGNTGIGVPEGGIAAIAAELAGRDLGDFFARYVDGTEDPPLAALLAKVGVALKLRPSRGARDKGGDAGPRGGNGDDDGLPRVTFGFVLAAGSEARLQHVVRGGPAERAGLAAGDVLVAIEGLRATAASIAHLSTQRRAGEPLAIHAFRRDELVSVVLTTDEAPLDTCWLELDASGGDAAKARRDAWLGPGA